MGRKHGFGRAKSRVVEATNLNIEAYNFYYQYLYGLVINSIVWENLPLSVNPRFLECTLAEMGYALFFEDEILGFLGLTCTIGGELDVYRIPIYRQAFATNGYRKNCSKTDSVIIFNNYQHIPDIMVIQMFARRLAIADRSMEINLNNQKFPLLISCSPQQKLSMENFYMNYDGNVPVIFTNKNFDPESVKVLKTDVPFVADKIITTKHHIMNDFLTWLGAENSNMDKKERMVSNEIGSNYGNVELSRNVRLSSRLDACDEINAMFGLDISCHFNSDLATMLNLGMEAWEGVSTDEPLYDSDPLSSGTGELSE